MLSDTGIKKDMLYSKLAQSTLNMHTKGTCLPGFFNKSPKNT